MKKSSLAQALQSKLLVSKVQATMVAPKAVAASFSDARVHANECIQQYAQNYLQHISQEHSNGTLTLRETLECIARLHDAMPLYVQGEVDLNTGLRYTCDDPRITATLDREVHNFYRKFECPSHRPDWEPYNPKLSEDDDGCDMPA